MTLAKQPQVDMIEERLASVRKGGEGVRKGGEGVIFRYTPVGCEKSMRENEMGRKIIDSTRVVKDKP
jgi:hypothetical protein